MVTFQMERDMVGSRMREALEQRGFALGSTTQMYAPEISEVQSAAGFDFVFIDMEHGALGIEAVTNLIRAVKAGGAATPIVRLPEASPVETARILDAGAQGIVVPTVESAEQIRAVVAAAYYAPRGRRGACPTVRANHHGVQPWAEYAEWSANNMFICATIESVKGVQNFEEIISVPGLDAISIGTFDLSLSMGYDGDYAHPEVVATFERLSEGARAKGLDIMGAVLDYNRLEAELDRLTAGGVRIVLFPGDRFLLSSIYRSAGQTVSRIRERRTAN